MKLLRKLYEKLVYGNDWELINHPARRTQDLMSWEAVAGATGLALIEGTFQTRFLLAIGADIDQLSLLTSLTLAASVSCLFGGLLFDKRKKKKNLIVPMLLLSRLCLAGTVFLPFLLGTGKAVVSLIIALTVAALAVTALADTGYNSLLCSVIPPEICGRMLAVRSTLNYIVTPLLPLVGAYLLDKSGDSLVLFAALAGVAAILIVLEAVLLWKVDEPEAIIPKREKKTRTKGELLERLREAKDFLLLTGECFFFYLFLYICGSFTPTYLNSTDYIGASALFLEIAALLMKLAMLFLCRIWGRMCDRVGSAKMTFLLQAFFGLEMLSWAIVPPKWLPTAIFIPYLCQASSNSMAGIAMTTRKFSALPKENQSTYLGLFGGVMALAYFVGPAIGRALLHFFETHLSEAMLADFWEIRFIYLIAAVLIFGQKLVTLIVRKKAEV